MSNLSLSDLSKSYQLRRDTVRVRQDLSRATQELSSGKTLNLGKAVSGNYASLISLDRQLSAIQAFRTNAQEAALFADTAQTSLTHIRQVSTDLISTLSTSDIVNNEAVLTVIGSEALSAFELTVSTMNATAGGRSIFAGTATDRPALAPAGDMLGDLRALVGAATTAADVELAVDTYFNAGGGFDAGRYLGSTTKLSEFRVAESREVKFNLTADDQVVRDQLKGLAMAVLVDDGALSASEKKALIGTSAARLRGNSDAMLDAQAQVGVLQSRIEMARAQNEAERTAYQMARTDIVSIEPFEVATELQNLQVQLETIYTITARLQSLSLMNFLR